MVTSPILGIRTDVPMLLLDWLFLEHSDTRFIILRMVHNRYHSGNGGSRRLRTIMARWL